MFTTKQFLAILSKFITWKLFNDKFSKLLYITKYEFFFITPNCPTFLMGATLLCTALEWIEIKNFKAFACRIKFPHAYNSCIMMSGKLFSYKVQCSTQWYEIWKKVQFGNLFCFPEWLKSMEQLKKRPANNISKNIDFRNWSNHLTTYRQICHCTIFPFLELCVVPPYLNFGWCINEVSDPQNMKMICKDLFWPQSCTSQKSKADDENHNGLHHLIWEKFIFVEIHLIRLFKVQQNFILWQRFLLNSNSFQQW